MPDWITPSEDDILTRCSGVELETFRGVVLAEGQADPLSKQIEIVVNFMRGYIFTCPNVKEADHEAGTIPSSALHVFLDIIVPTIQGRPAGAVIEGTNGIRLDARSDAMRWLKAASKCEVAVDEVPSPVTPGAPIPTPRIKKRSRNNCDGI